jgi:hypothetical protein
MRSAPDTRARVLSFRGDSSPLDPGSLRALFLDLVGRPPLAGERERWLGKERPELLADLIGSEAFWQAWLEEQLYYFLLIDHFRPTTDGVQNLPAELAAGRLGVREALHRTCLSSSFDRRNPGPDTFVTVVMEQLLGITVQKSTRELDVGKKLYDGGKGKFLGQPGSSQADVVHIAIGDPRSLRHLLSREHERILRESPSAAELSRDVTRLEEDELSYPSILRAWFLSEAYERRLGRRVPMPNRLFVRAFFVDLFDRVPDQTETQRIRSALDGLADSVPLRSIIARSVLESGKAPVPGRKEIEDPGAWIDGLFERLLGRAPSSTERAVFLESFAEPECRPEMVLFAIFSHPQYQTW